MTFWPTVSPMTNYCKSSYMKYSWILYFLLISKMEQKFQATSSTFFYQIVPWRRSLYTKISPEFFLLSFLFSFIFKLMKILKRMHTFSHNWWRFIGASLTSKLHIKNCETFTSRPHYSLTRILKRGQGWAPGTRGRHNIDMRPEVSEIREGGVEMECGGGGGVRQNHYLCGEECRACVESLTLLPPPPPQPGTVSSTHTHQLNHHSRHWGHPLSSYGNGREKNVIITWGAVHHS